jgi:hypothetical protein
MYGRKGKDMTEQTKKTAHIRRSLLSIWLDAGKGRGGTCKTEADFDKQCELVQNAGYELIDLDAHDASTGRPLPSNAWAWRK